MNIFRSLFTKNTCMGLIGTFLFISGIIILFLWNWFFDFILSSMLVLKPNSFTLEVWKKPPMTLALDFYFFNWTNPEEINDPTKKPKFQEMGPYRFTEHREKVNITWNDSNNTVSYRLLRYWYFDEENSVGKLSDKVVTLNAVTASAANQVKHWSYFMQRSFSLTLVTISPEVHIIKPIGQLLFEGYEDPFVDIALTLPFIADTLPPFDKFGWFYTRNASYAFDGTFNMNTGINNTYGELNSWNYESDSPALKAPCRKVHGSGAELYPQFVQRDHIGFFSPDMCRFVQLDYEDDVNVKGIPGYKFSAQHSMLDNGTNVPENKCFCDGECIPSGLLNVSSCRYNTPAFVSLPHFYGADPVYGNMIEGMAPKKSKHEVYITLEPRTGIALDVAVRLQLNLRLQRAEHITLYENVAEVFFPMLWFEQKASIPDNLTWAMKILLLAPTISVIFGTLLIIGGLSVLVYLSLKIIKRIDKYNKHLVYKPTFEEVPLQTSKQQAKVVERRKPNYIDLVYSN